MKVRLIASYGVAAHDKFPVYSYCPAVDADKWDCQENVWVELPDEYVAGRTEFGDLVVNFGNGDWPLANVISNYGDDPVLIVPDARYPRRTIPLRVLTAQELPRATPGESSIARLRRERGMTQADLAKLVGVEPAHIGRWERGERNPKLGALKKIAAALNVDLGELV